MKGNSDLRPSMAVRKSIDGTNHILTANLGGTYECLGSSVLNGGLSEADHILMCQVDTEHVPDEEPEVTLGDLAERQGLGGRCIGFMTAADIHRVASVRTEAVGDVSATAIVTAGLGNGIVAGESFSHIPEQVEEHRSGRFGTINIACVSSVPLDDAAKANALIVIAESKAVALRELGFAFSGTTTDSHSILSPPGAVKARYCGTGTDIGLAIARSVRSALRESLMSGGELPM